MDITCGARYRADQSPHPGTESPTSKEETTTITVDVRTTPPRDRHALVFRLFDQLSIGDALEMIDDHDPRSLLNQFQAEAAAHLLGTISKEVRRRGGCALARREAPLHAFAGVPSASV